MKTEIIETIINTAALSLTAYGITQITSGDLKGYIALGVGMGLEFLKYYGRRKLW